MGGVPGVPPVGKVGKDGGTPHPSGLDGDGGTQGIPLLGRMGVLPTSWEEWGRTLGGNWQTNGKYYLPPSFGCRRWIFRMYNIKWGFEFFHTYRITNLILLPPAYVVWREVMLAQVCVCSTLGGYPIPIHPHPYLSLSGGGGTRSSLGRGGTLIQPWMGGTPSLSIPFPIHPCLGGYPIQPWMGDPNPALDGGVPQLWMGDTPSPGGYPIPCLGGYPR